MYWGSICNVTDRNARGVGVTGEHAYGLAFVLAVGAYVMCHTTGISVLRLRLRTGDQFRENHFLPFIYNILQHFLGDYTITQTRLVGSLTSRQKWKIIQIFV